MQPCSDALLDPFPCEGVVPADSQAVCWPSFDGSRCATQFTSFGCVHAAFRVCKPSPTCGRLHAARSLPAHQCPSALPLSRRSRCVARRGRTFRMIPTLQLWVSVALQVGGAASRTCFVVKWHYKDSRKEIESNSEVIDSSQVRGRALSNAAAWVWLYMCTGGGCVHER